MTGNNHWDGHFFAQKFSFLTFVDSLSEELWGAAATATAGTVIPPADLGNFLIIHASAELFTHDAAHLHWAVHEHLRREGDTKGTRALWESSRSCRLHDVMLLDQRIRLVMESVYPRPRRLADLADRHGGGEPSTEVQELLGQAPEIRLQPENYALAIRVAKSILAIYTSLRQEAEGIRAFLGTPHEVISKFGPLAVGVDVQGAIAVASASRNGLKVDREAAAEIDHFFSSELEKHSALLSGDVDARKAFSWEPKIVFAPVRLSVHVSRSPSPVPCLRSGPHQANFDPANTPAGSSTKCGVASIYSTWPNPIRMAGWAICPRRPWDRFWRHPRSGDLWVTPGSPTHGRGLPGSLPGL